MAVPVSMQKAQLEGQRLGWLRLEVLSKIETTDLEVSVHEAV